MLGGELTNEGRADIGMAAAQKVAEMTGLDIDSELDAAVTDTIANLMHLCRVQEINFERCFGSAQMHFDAELAEASIEAAKAIAGKSASVLDTSIDRKIDGVYMGCTDTHAVLSLGRTAVIVDFKDFSMTVDRVGPKDNVSLEFKGGKGVMTLIQKQQGIER